MDKRIVKIQKEFQALVEQDQEKMRSSQIDKKHEITLALKRKTSKFRSKYGDRWKEVMHATATKLAMKEEKMQEDKHTAGATRPERMIDKFTLSDKKFADAHGGIDGNDSGIDGAKAAQQTVDSIKASGPSMSHVNRPADQSTGDKSIIDKASDITQRAGFKEAKTYEDLLKVLMEK